MKKLLENKKALVVIISVVLVIILIIALIVINLNRPVSLKCEREQQLVLGIDLDEDLIIKLDKKNKINRIKIEKTIKLDNYYQQFDTHKNAIYDHMKEAYKYLPDKAYQVKNEKEEIEVLVDTDSEGVILNNLEITRLSESDRKDIKINSSNILESSSSTYKIGDEYKKEELVKKLEGLGYTCKK